MQVSPRHPWRRIAAGAALSVLALCGATTTARAGTGAAGGGAKGIPDPACRGKSWVKPITTLDAYLMVYEVVELEGQAFDANDIAAAQPPASGAAGPGPTTPAALAARAAAVARTRPGTGGLPSVRQLAALGQRLSSARLLAEMGSNAIAVGSAGTRDHRHGMLLGNPHFVWAGPGRFFEVQLTIPGVSPWP